MVLLLKVSFRFSLSTYEYEKWLEAVLLMDTYQEIAHYVAFKSTTTINPIEMLVLLLNVGPANSKMWQKCNKK